MHHHHHPQNQERAFNMLILTVSRLCKFSPSPLTWWCPSVDFCKFRPCDHTAPVVKSC
ncbi:hypothetical protein M441DRAFT_153910 [Trichoderma asperellum CBS 433.97]|uniref:Uncharacterized protein n=1 Tax=Trichoderma asperellum (strain ATCC 204424 / CBS 433.97 / NBRC 101777) TaxID=1042311 RepID=A0A2T3YRQ0_TRIA4|nr:hypothetical protein M441DRAFT_153910 [Trichoderma asperellum CBS 433.97]PTB35250.1 hypothetical protein M441DRAFT_153910 [Trichoderma asperellum CBS 433.97]